MSRKRIILTAVLLIPIIAVAYFIILINSGSYYFEFLIHDGDPQSIPSEALSLSDTDYSETVNQAQILTRSLLKNDNLPGLSVAVAAGNNLVWTEGFGWADLKKRSPVAPSTKFRIGSAGTAFTAAAAGLLAERGLIDLDAPVRKYVPSFPKKKWNVSLRQVLANVAGIPRYKDEIEIFSHDHYREVVNSLDRFAAKPLQFEPLTEYRYSSNGWVLAGAVIQAASGEPYADFMQQEIFSPAGMTCTVPDNIVEEPPDCARFYWPFLAMNTHYGIENASFTDLSAVLPAGGFLSTAADLARFGMAMLSGNLLKPEIVEMLWSGQELKSGERTGAGLGWKFRRVPPGKDAALSTMIYAPGYTIGGTAALVIFPDQMIVVATVSNVSFAKGILPFTVKLAGLFK